MFKVLIAVEKQILKFINSEILKEANFNRRITSTDNCHRLNHPMTTLTDVERSVADPGCLS
jgi:hypothetical protein